jgi:hypothetical protein
VKTKNPRPDPEIEEGRKKFNLSTTGVDAEGMDDRVSELENNYVNFPSFLSPFFVG